jgi:membrane associated rhomboid family serine protease
MFRNTPTVTQNLIIVNILFFVATFVLEQQGVDLGTILGAHYFNTPLFKPWQLITHAFMHADIFHIFMNMQYTLFSHVQTLTYAYVRVFEEMPQES